MRDTMLDFEKDDMETLKGRFLTFLLENKVYGIEIKYVKEIVGMQTITEVPEMPEYIKGLVNLRGKIIPVMDIRARFGMEEASYDDRTCIIIISFNEKLCGFIVDSVSEVLTIQESNIEEMPDIGAAQNGFVKNVGNEGDSVVLLLACDKLITA